MRKKRNKQLSYEEQRKIWYEKLKDDGFEDIEDYGRDTLKRWATSITGDLLRVNSKIVIEAKEEYYAMCRYLLSEYKFANNKEQIIWEYHTEGISARNIVKLLKQARVCSTNRTAVLTIIKRLENTMKDMYLYKPEKTNAILQ